MSESAKPEDIYSQVRSNQRLSPRDALKLLKTAPWLETAQLAWERRSRQNGSKEASYTVFGIVNYTNVCDIGCSFCGFKRRPKDKDAYLLNEGQILDKTNYAISQGADQIFLQGGARPDLPLEYYTNILKSVKAKHNTHIRAFSPAELKYMAAANNLPISRIVSELKAAGLDSLPGAGAEILSDRVREKLSPKKCKTREWADIIEECHRQRLFGTANMVLGSIETEKEIVEHLDIIRDIQDRTGGFHSFVLWTFQDQTGEFPVRRIPSHQYLKVLAVSRLYLDNIKNIEVSAMVLGKDIARLALRMGANDISSPVIEENVLTSFGVKTEEEAENLIREAGFIPVRRDFNYNKQKINGRPSKK